MPVWQLQQHGSNDDQHVEKTTQTLCDKDKSQFAVIALTAALLVSAGPVTVYWLDNQTQLDSYVAQPALISIAGECSLQRQRYLRLYKLEYYLA